MNCERFGSIEFDDVFLYPKNFKDKVLFQNIHCEFSPVGWTVIDDNFYPLGYKVVTGDLKSLGLRKNPNIMEFPTGQWVRLPENLTVPGDSDFGGIWSALRKSSIKKLQKHCLETHGVETRAFLVAIDNPMYANSYRIKSQGVMLLEEVFSSVNS
jgi:hypothetical protein